MTTKDLANAIEQSHAALAAILKGDPSGYKALYSEGEDVTLGNPFGPYARGRKNVEATLVRISDERDRPFRDRDRRFRQRDRSFRERDRADRKAGMALRMTSTTRAMLAGFCRREHACAPDEHAHDQGRFKT